MAEEQTATKEASPPVVTTQVAPGPHIVSTSLTTRKMMLDVLIGLAPILFVAGYVFRMYALKQIGICVGSCLAAEAIFTAMRCRKATLSDLSAVVTGVILALSLPGTAPWFVGVIGSFVAIGIGKIVFGGLGQNIFNPAMVGRAFVMIAFAGLMGASGYIAEEGPGVPDAMTQATPMTAMRAASQNTNEPQAPKNELLIKMLLGNINGSLGETSALAALLGGLYLCWRRTASWEIPLGTILAVAIIAGIQQLMNPGAEWTVLHHLLGGALLFGAFFIVTDPVSSPLTSKGKLIFGFAFGAMVMVLRLFSSYPEGVMFAVLLVNAIVPLINRWTIPRPVGGPMPAPAAK